MVKIGKIVTAQDAFARIPGTILSVCASRPLPGSAFCTYRYLFDT